MSRLKENTRHPLDWQQGIISNLGMDSKHKITAFYKFTEVPEDKIDSVQGRLLERGTQLKIKGLIILATEGINGTISGEPALLDQYKAEVPEIIACREILFKDSWAKRDPFRRFKVKIRSEIVTLGDPSLFPNRANNNHLSPSEWNRIIESEDVLVIDTRNKYETELGKFKNALDPNLNTFQEFGKFVDEADLPKDKKILMYCTGGIRCEKAILEMQRRGYHNVFQLEGGILKYLEEYPNKHYEGECFVFDHRVSVDQELKPSKTYHLCVHCGNPGHVTVSCSRCAKPGRICRQCERSSELVSCSKDCAYHLATKSQKGTDLSGSY